MSNIPEDLKYTRTHEWVMANDDGTLTVGITDHAQELLGDLVFVESPAEGARIVQNEACGVVESVKAASDLYAPVEGDVVAVNESLVDAPEQINGDPYGGGWMYKMRPADEAAVAALLDADGYRSLLADEA